VLPHQSNKSKRSKKENKNNKYKKILKKYKINRNKMDDLTGLDTGVD
jgi:hypothetical protein